MQDRVQAQDAPQQDQLAVQQDPQQQQRLRVNDQSAAAPTVAHAATAEATAGHGGNDPLGRKEELLRPFFADMQEVATTLAPQFTGVGLHFRPEILLATAMQEAANKDPLNNRSFDNGLGIMQITPYKGQLDANVAKAIGWDNTQGVEHNIQHSNWRNAKANLMAGGYTLLGKAHAIKHGVAATWESMDENHRWRASMYAYNAGEGAAIRALKQGGPNASMISTFTNPQGKVVSHDYTAEIQGKLDYVEGHDPFTAGGNHTQAGPAQAKPSTAAPAPAHGQPAPAKENHIHGSVGLSGKNAKADVLAVQTRLRERGLDPGAIDGSWGPKTLHALLEFQSTFMKAPDGIIEPGHGTEHHLFDQNGAVAHTEKQSPGAAAPQHAAQHAPEVVAGTGGLPNINPGVHLTPAIETAYRVLVSYLPGGTHMTSGYRSDADQAAIINNYFGTKGGPASITDVEQRREWLQSHKGMIIGKVGSSPHRTGLAFDLSGAPLNAIDAAVHKCAKEHPDTFHFSRLIHENANNCIHVEVTH